jgi:hypothetical protein
MATSWGRLTGLPRAFTLTAELSLSLTTYKKGVGNKEDYSAWALVCRAEPSELVFSTGFPLRPSSQVGSRKADPARWRMRFGTVVSGQSENLL